MDKSHEYFLYEQRTGRFFVVTREAVLAPLGRGYSGRGAGLNNPERESVKGQGPIPCGLWRISSPINHPKLGRLAFALAYEEAGRIAPAPYGRSAFLIHGDNFAANRTASSGCIILGPSIRFRIREHFERGVHHVVVVPG